MRDSVAAVLVVFSIVLFFAPLLLIGITYILLVLLYFLGLYLAEKPDIGWLSEVLSAAFALVFAYLLMEKLGRWDARLFALFAVLVSVSTLRRLKNEGRANPDVG